MKLVDQVQEFLDKKCNILALGFYTNTITDLEEFEKKEGKSIKSPVEQLFFIEWAFRKFCNLEYKDINLKPQYQDESTGKYRLDFMVDFIQDTNIKIEHPKLGIEIDGYIWHEKTKNQVQYHKERERFLIKNGWKLLRFTGSEVFKNPEKCLQEVLDVIKKLRDKYHKNLYQLLNGKKE